MKVTSQELYHKQWRQVGESHTLNLFFQQFPKDIYQLAWEKRLMIQLDHPYWNYGNVLMDATLSEKLQHQTHSGVIPLEQLRALIQKKRAVVVCPQLKDEHYTQLKAVKMLYDETSPVQECHVYSQLPDGIKSQYFTTINPLFDVLNQPLEGFTPWLERLTPHLLVSPLASRVKILVRKGNLAEEFMSFSAFDALMTQLQEDLQSLMPNHPPIRPETWSAEFESSWTLDYQEIVSKYVLKFKPEEVKLLGFLLMGYPLEMLWSTQSIMKGRIDLIGEGEILRSQKWIRQQKATPTLRLMMKMSLIPMNIQMFIIFFRQVNIRSSIMGMLISYGVCFLAVWFTLLIHADYYNPNRPPR